MVIPALSRELKHSSKMNLSSRIKCRMTMQTIEKIAINPRSSTPSVSSVCS